ncbi:RadC family protein [Pseudoxanthomonas winnipegensis]|uniref:DNA repair protein RadC n=1 Tax=Pseudoxanthomonas winnipegensis TaxID=2480810 RepID=A0A4Q8LJX7_9GAMM|nr:DNA repair protein RadC [Pseudoxanthomonas winnipegensis]RZZ87778.1 DNA repair protein RadC [Pseudoxanthomonas winnipegensis]TAA29916.1 DNA repair protein RadC [Pseudoxanthomonas winnipegensis]TAA40715.1 DNA repair protein RadC [Pseudoxanthomonas winnipegensis]TBV78057.1 DNA repair protein RadC [Pseudoxanthomonas winnipegensis]
MSHDLFSSLDSFAAVPSAAGSLLVRDVAGEYCSVAPAEVLQAALRVLAGQLRGTELLSSPQAVRDFLRIKLGTLEHEVFAVIHLDAQHRVIEYVEMFRGTVSQTSVYPREIVKEALARNSAALILVHNHPPGVAEPSRADEMLTQTLKSALSLVDVRVIDHLIVAGPTILSFAERGLI